MKKLVYSLFIFVFACSFIFSQSNEEENAEELKDDYQYTNMIYSFPCLNSSELLTSGLGLSTGSYFSINEKCGLKNEAMIFFALPNDSVERKCREELHDFNKSVTIYDSLQFAFHQSFMDGKFMFNESLGLYISLTNITEKVEIEARDIRYSENTFSFGFPVSLEFAYFVTRELGLNFQIEFPLTIIANSIGTYEDNNRIGFYTYPMIQFGFVFRNEK